MENSLSKLQEEREKLLRELEETENISKKQKFDEGDVSNAKARKKELKKLKKEAKARKKEKEKRKADPNKLSTLQEEKERLLKELTTTMQESPNIQIKASKSKLLEEKERLQRELNEMQGHSPKSKLQEEKERLQRELNDIRESSAFPEIKEAPKSKLQEEKERLQRELNEMQGSSSLPEIKQAPKSKLQLEKERLERELNELQESSGLKRRKYDQLSDSSSSIMTNPDLQQNTIVFIGNLSWKVQNDDVEKFFEERGCTPIHNIRWMNDQQTGLWKGCGHITFHSSEMAFNAVKYNGTPFVDGRPMKLELPRIFDPLRDLKRIHISGVPQGTDAEEFVRTFFTERGIQAGEIDTINIVKESFIHERKMHTGECFVLFKSVEAAKMAIQAANKEQGIFVQLASELKQKKVDKTSAKPATLFIGGEAFSGGDVRARIIEEIFGEFGTIDRIRYGTNRKCVFVEYAEESSCDKAINRSKENPFIIYGKRVLVDRARA